MPVKKVMITRSVRIATTINVHSQIINRNLLAVSFVWWRKLEYPVKTTNLPQLTGKLYHKVLCWQHLARSGVRASNFSDYRHDILTNIALQYLNINMMT
jgi:hypothetical protein